MSSIREFLTTEFLPKRDGLEEPDGRLLHLYKCEDEEFWYLVNLLREVDPPNGYDFDRYRELWRQYREEFQDIDGQSGFQPFEMPEIDWTVRGFVLYASEFWLRFRDKEWRTRSFPDRLPFKKLTWLQFLSLVGWTDLYRDKIAGYVDLQGTQSSYRVAHTSKRHAESFEDDDREDESRHYDERSVDSAGYYPGLYLPMLAAWHWWKVAPIRLPTSIRYLDTFAHQGGAGDRLVIECVVDRETDSEVIYRPTKPPNGYGIRSFPIEWRSLPPEADHSELNVTLLFGAHGGSRGV